MKLIMPGRSFLKHLPLLLLVLFSTVQVLLSDFTRAGERLAEALSEPETDFLRDACIQVTPETVIAWHRVAPPNRSGHGDSPAQRPLRGRNSC
jgi:hypothetical protein